MYRVKFNEKNRPYVLKRSAKHRPVCTCGTYLKTVYVQERVSGTARWVKVGYYCPSCSDFYRNPPDQSIINHRYREETTDIAELKHNLEKLFSRFD